MPQQWHKVDNYEVRYVLLPAGLEDVDYKVMMGLRAIASTGPDPECVCVAPKVPYGIEALAALLFVTPKALVGALQRLSTIPQPVVLVLSQEGLIRLSPQGASPNIFRCWDPKVKALRAEANARAMAERSPEKIMDVMGVWICPDCKAKVDIQATSCPYCGVVTEEKKPESASTVAPAAKKAVTAKLAPKANGRKEQFMGLDLGPFRAKFADIDIEWELGRCIAWWEGNPRRGLKAPALAFGNWCENAMKFKGKAERLSAAERLSEDPWAKDKAYAEECARDRS